MGAWVKTLRQRVLLERACHYFIDPSPPSRHNYVHNYERAAIMVSIRADDIKSATEFRSKMREHLSRLKENGRAEVLTVNGEAEAVVMSPATFQQLIDDAEYGRSIRLIRQSMQQFKDGKGVAADAVFAELRAKLDDDGA
jgi:PHD/YefM family antitoxin component YafN of YafNO toxin-antitoxin module